MDQEFLLLDWEILPLDIESLPIDLDFLPLNKEFLPESGTFLGFGIPSCGSESSTLEFLPAIPTNVQISKKARRSKLPFPQPSHPTLTAPRVAETARALGPTMAAF